MCQPPAWRSRQLEYSTSQAETFARARGSQLGGGRYRGERSVRPKRDLLRSQNRIILAIYIREWRDACWGRDRQIAYVRCIIMWGNWNLQRASVEVPMRTSHLVDFARELSTSSSPALFSSSWRQCCLS